MKLLLALLLSSCAQLASATILRLETVTQPLYLHGSDTDILVTFQAVPFVTYSSDPEWRFSAISTPCIPATVGSWAPHDVNLASLYGITVSGTYKQGSKDLLITIDASKAACPDGYPFTVDQAIDAVTTCVKIMYPARPLEEGGLDIAVTRPGGNPDTRR